MICRIAPLMIIALMLVGCGHSVKTYARVTTVGALAAADVDAPTTIKIKDTALRIKAATDDAEARKAELRSALDVFPKRIRAVLIAGVDELDMKIEQVLASQPLQDASQLWGEAIDGLVEGCVIWINVVAPTNPTGHNSARIEFTNTE